MRSVPHEAELVKSHDQKPVELQKTIWSIAGGKGGTGKTILTANLGIGLAILGYKVVLIDADLGVPNLHNYLRIKRPRVTLDDFLTKNVDTLSDILIETPHSNLRFIGGGTSLVGNANLPYVKKQKLIRHINKLKADIILVDLGAGISHNTIDFLNVSTREIVVSNPEPNASQDAYFFLKNAVYRRIKSYMKIDANFKEAFKDYSSTNGNGTFDIPKFYNYLQSHSKQVYNDLDQYLSLFQPRLILNKLRKRKHKKEGDWFVNLVRTFLEVNMDFIGTLRYDKRIIQTSEDIYPFSIRYPNAAISKNLFSILSSLYSFEQSKHDVNTFRQFKALLKDQKKLWE